MSFIQQVSLVQCVYVLVCGQILSGYITVVRFMIMLRLGLEMKNLTGFLVGNDCRRIFWFRVDAKNV